LMMAGARLMFTRLARFAFGFNGFPITSCITSF
jgi:hypothetical protein